MTGIDLLVLLAGLAGMYYLGFFARGWIEDKKVTEDTL